MYRTDHARTTWKFRAGVVIVLALLAWLTRPWWTVAVAESLVCAANGAPSDAILIENFDSDNYLTFERATELRRDGLAARVIVPVTADERTLQPNAVALGAAQVLARVARLGDMDVVPIREIEPISLNAARDVLRFAEQQRIRSVVVVSPYFRSRRSALVYGAVLGSAGITVTCEPVRGTPHTWMRTWHGIENVVEQWIKLQYYRWYVLPFLARRQSPVPLG